MTETVMMDEGGVKITATGLAYTESSADLAITIEKQWQRFVIHQRFFWDIAATPSMDIWSVTAI